MKMLTVFLVVFILGFDFATPKRKSYDMLYFIFYEKLSKANLYINRVTFSGPKNMF